MQMFLGIVGSTAALFGTFLLYLAIAVLVSNSFEALFGKKDKTA